MDCEGIFNARLLMAGPKVCRYIGEKAKDSGIIQRKAGYSCNGEKGKVV
jgi:hypothetical protein